MTVTDNALQEYSLSGINVPDAYKTPSKRGYDSKETSRRKEDVKSQFDRLSERPPSSDTKEQTVFGGLMGLSEEGRAIVWNIGYKPRKTKQ